MRKLLVPVLILLLLAVLAVTNPGWDEYEHIARTRIADTYTDATGNRNAFMRWMGGEMAWPVIRKQTERRNFFLFSIYDLDLTGTELQGIEHTYLGIFGQFIPLRQNNDVTINPGS